MDSSPEIFDVYLTGTKDKSPAVQMRMVASIAARCRLSALAVAEALEGTPCRVAAGLPRREAQSLVEVLENLGAIASCIRAGASVSAAGSASPTSPTSAPGAGPSRTKGAQPPKELISPPRRDGRITLRSADVTVPALVEVSEPIEFAEPSPEGKTGVRGSDTARCPIHGLAYNRRKASGCVQCLATARAHARRLKEESLARSPQPQSAAGSSLKNNPLRRAFWGVAVALLVGFVPAAYYARGPNRRELTALRAEQAALSEAPATKESLARFDALDAAVDRVHRRGAGRTLMIWLLAGGLTGLGWTGLTRPSQADAGGTSID